MHQLSFLSTPSGWRATGTAGFYDTLPDDFYPRPPGGGRLEHQDIKLIHNAFLSTPSGWRATGSFTPSHSSTKNFYPRPPGGGRHRSILSGSKVNVFLSTPSGWRATVCPHQTRAYLHHFYPRPPGGGRRRKSVCMCTPLQWISIHALRVEGDEHKPSFDIKLYEFLSTPSGWRATSGS